MKCSATKTWYNSPVEKQDYRKAEAPRDHSSPNPQPWSRTPGCSWSCSCPVIFWVSPCWRQPPGNLFSVWQMDIKQKIIQILPDYSNPDHPIPEGKSLVSGKTSQAVSYKRLKSQSSRRFPFPNRLQRIFLGGGKKDKPKPNKYNHTRKISTFFPLNLWILQPLFGFSMSSSWGWRGQREGAPALLVLQQLQSLDAVAAGGARAQLRHRLPLQIQRGHGVGAIGRAWENRFYFKTNSSNNS